MKIDRLDLDGVGSPTAIAAKIHELEPQLPSRVPVEELCRRFDIQSINEFETEGFEAALLMDELKASGAILVAKGRSWERRRYSIAHELGHFLIPAHRPSSHSDSFECSLSDLHLLDHRDRDRRRRIEAEANRFAAHLLMPPDQVRAQIRQTSSTLESIVAMARKFGVSKEAMARAWIEAHREAVAVILVHRGRILRRYRNEDFPWIPDRQGQLPESSHAVSELAPGSFSRIEEIDPEVWFEARDAARILSLSEQVLGQRDGYSLVLLQAELDEEIDD